MTRGEKARPLPPLRLNSLGEGEDDLEPAAAHDHEDAWATEEQQATVQAELELCLAT